MKKTTAVILLAAILITASACAVHASDRLVPCGGWQCSQDPALTDELLEVFRKATDTLCGVEYTPVAYLGSQIVAGTNYCILCRADVSTAELRDGSGKYVLMYIYEDLSGNAEILTVSDLDITAPARY